MRIAILGSKSSESPVEDFDRNRTDQFDAACEELGTSLATAEVTHEILVESDGSRTVDLVVVNAMRALQATDRRCVVECWYRTKPKPGESEVEEPYRGSDYGWIRKRPVPFAHVGSVHVRMMQSADVVIVVGGGRNTYLAGQVARATGTRLIPVSAFGGAGRLLWYEAEAESHTDSLASKLMEPHRFRNLDTLELVVSSILAEIDSLPRVMVVHGRSRVRDGVKKALCDSGATPIVMRESSLEGSTIPEEFERPPTVEPSVPSGGS